MNYHSMVLFICSLVTRIRYAQSTVQPNVTNQCFTIGKLYNCQQAAPLGYFELPTIAGCENINKDDQKLVTFKGRILRYNPAETDFVIWQCKLTYIRTECSTFGEVTVKTVFAKIPEDYCKDMITLKKTTGHYKETLEKLGRAYYRNVPEKAPNCKLFNEAFTFYEPYFELRG